MRTCTCTQCGNKFNEDDSNPNIHYSNPANICPHCDIYNKKSIGEWYQDRDGEYKQKQPPTDDIIDKISKINAMDHMNQITSIREIVAFNYCKQLIIEMLMEIKS
jgi:hypothetical protein